MSIWIWLPLALLLGSYLNFLVIRSMNNEFGYPFTLGDAFGCVVFSFMSPVFAGVWLIQHSNDVVLLPPKGKK